jgi:hypothetical protein
MSPRGLERRPCRHHYWASDERMARHRTLSRTDAEIARYPIYREQELASARTEKGDGLGFAWLHKVEVAVADGQEQVNGDDAPAEHVKDAGERGYDGNDQADSIVDE